MYFKKRIISYTYQKFFKMYILIDEKMFNTYFNNLIIMYDREIEYFYIKIKWLNLVVFLDKNLKKEKVYLSHHSFEI